MAGRARDNITVRVAVAALVVVGGWCGLSSIAMARAAHAQDAPTVSTTSTVPASSPVSIPDAPSTTLRVVTKPLDPFVVRTEKGEVGFSIDLWNELARRNGWTTQWVQAETVTELLDTVRSGGADVGIAGVSMTSEREQTLDFSYPMFDSGLQVMVVADSSSSFSHLMSAVFTKQLGMLALLLLALVVVLGHFVWLVQRRSGAAPRSYVKGVGHGSWLVAVTGLAGDIGEGAPRKVLGRVVAILWLLVGVLLVAVMTASVTSRLTVDSIESKINGLGDLADKRVATVNGSTAAKYLDGINQSYQGVDSIEDAYPLLHAGKVAAVVFDAPVLAHHALVRGGGREKLVGNVFNREFYGIALPIRSAVREQLNQTLLSVKADGTYQRIYEQWFGRDD
jgi:polar amino acid transport system substrate-binding protein